jgi:lysophospholipase
LADGAGPVAAPLHPLSDGPEGGAAFWLTAEDGVRLRVAVWGQAGARGTVLVFPGRTEAVEKYGRLARNLGQTGLATMAIDWRGQGLADRLIANPALGHVGHFADYQRDVAAMVAHAKALELPQPWYLLAHSMGGCIGLRAVIDGLPVKAVAFSAPMWGIGISTVMRPVAWTVSTLSRPLGFDRTLAPGQSPVTYLLREPFAGNTLTSDQDGWDYMASHIKADPRLALGGPTLAWLNESLREMRALFALPSPQVPCVTFIGSGESIIDPVRVHERMARWPGGDLVILHGGRHEVLMETPAIRARILARLGQLFV